MEQNCKTRTLKIRGEEVEVSDEVYRAYVRPIRAEQRRKRREWKCRVLSESGNYYVRCTKSCETCPYYLAGNAALGNVTSLDKLIGKGVEIEDMEADLESRFIEQETLKEEYSDLHKAIASLTQRQQEMIQMIYFEGKSQEEVAKLYRVGKQAISNAMQRIYAQLEKKLK